MVPKKRARDHGNVAAAVVEDKKPAETCMVCTEEYSVKVPAYIVPSCAHTICGACGPRIFGEPNSPCPMCRRAFQGTFADMRTAAGVAPPPMVVCAHCELAVMRA